MPRVSKKSSAKSSASARPKAKRAAYTYRDYRKASKAEQAGKGMKYPGAGSKIGSAIGSVFGPAGSLVGSALGGLAHNALHYLTGFGDYQIKKNALMETNDPPRVLNRGKEFVVRHREYITDIYSSPVNALNSPSPFNIQKFTLQPADFNTFPWLSQISSKFEQYRIEGMIFEYKAMYSDAVVTQNGAIGNIILATEYNAGQPAFPNKIVMENYEFAQSCKPSQSVIHPIECARSQNVLSELYVRSGSVPAGEDIKTYDFGDFYIASVGIPTATANTPINLGELWVSYQISFLKPKIFTSSGSYIDSGWAHFTTSAPSASFGASTVMPGNPAPTTSSNITGIAFVNANALTIPRLSVAMNYLVQAQWVDAGGSASPSWIAPVATVSGGSFVPGFGQTNVTQIPNAALSSNGAHTSYMVNVPAATAAGQTTNITYSSFTAPASLTIRVDVMINAVPVVVN